MRTHRHVIGLSAVSAACGQKPARGAVAGSSDPEPYSSDYEVES